MTDDTPLVDALGRRRTARSFAAEAAFRASLAELGATLLEPQWLGALSGHHVRCVAGHDTWPKPNNVQQGHGICRTCCGLDPVVAEAAFRRRLAEIGATPLFSEWLGVNRQHHVRCSSGHDCFPLPTNVQQGWGICGACVGRDRVEAERRFREQLDRIGAVPLFGDYRGSKRRHHVRCAGGHDWWPRPGNLREDMGGCSVCGGRDPGGAEARFLAALQDLGATPDYDEWTGSGRSYQVLCAAGHRCRALPSRTRRGEGFCKRCAGLDPADADAAFRARLAELGAIPLYEMWLGTETPHHVRCAEGHDCYPAPGNVRGGHGPCIVCAGQSHDVFYVVGSTRDPVVKFGISSRDGRLRLGTHRRDGLDVTHLLVTGLPGRAARAAEDAVRSALALAREKPVRGREYFDISCLALILDVADGWLAPDALAG